MQYTHYWDREGKVFAFYSWGAEEALRLADERDTFVMASDDDPSRKRCCECGAVMLAHEYSSLPYHWKWEKCLRCDESGE